MNTSKPEKTLIIIILLLAIAVSYIQTYKLGQRNGIRVCEEKLEAVSEVFATDQDGFCK